MARRFVPTVVSGRGRFPSRRSTAWSSSADVSAETSVGANSVLLDQVLTPTVTEQTITRVRGLLTIRSDQVIATEAQLGAFGMAVVEEPAATAGVSAVPTPITDAASEAWFLWQAIGQTLHVADATGMIQGVQYVLESKAMRKVNSEQRVVVVFENSSASAGFAFWYHFRMLSILKS